MTLYIETLRKCMEVFKIPKKLINMCKTCVQKTRSVVRRKIKQDSNRGPSITNIIQLSIIKSDTKYKNGSWWYKDW